jgi:hypothetical protein
VPAIANANNTLLNDPWAFRNPFFSNGLFNPFYNPFFFPNYYSYLSYLYGNYPASLLYGLNGYPYGGYGYSYGGYPSALINGASGYSGPEYANPYVNSPYAAVTYSNPYSAGLGSYGLPAGQSNGPGSAGAVLAASGVPADGGKIDWPLALRILPGAEPLRKQIDSLYQVAAAQITAGSISPGLPRELYRAVEKLEKLLLQDKFERMTLSSDMYAQTEQFLRQMKQGARNVQALAQAAPASSSSSVPNYTQQPR